MTAAEPMFAAAPSCAYYVVTEPQTNEVVAVVEAGDESEAKAFFGVLRHMLRAAPESRIRLMSNELPPNGVPVFRMEYLKALQSQAEDEGRLPGTTRH